MGIDLSGRVALVTGGAVRIGAAISRALAAAGATVTVHHHRSAAEAEALVEAIEAEGGGAFTVCGDLAESEDRDALIEAVLQRAGRLDILVNNASVFERRPLSEMTSEAARRMWLINAEAPLMLTHAAAPHLAAADPGAVVNLVDNASGRSDWPNHSHYCASKSALMSITRSLAKELAPAIRVNAVGPGAILFQDWESEARRNEVLRAIPMGRQGTVEEVAETVVFLAGGPTYITGQRLDVDGGWSLS